MLSMTLASKTMVPSQTLCRVNASRTCRLILLLLDYLKHRKTSFHLVTHLSSSSSSVSYERSPHAPPLQKERGRRDGGDREFVIRKALAWRRGRNRLSSWETGKSRLSLLFIWDTFFFHYCSKSREEKGYLLHVLYYSTHNIGSTFPLLSWLQS